MRQLEELLEPLGLCVTKVFDRYPIDVLLK